MLISKQQLACHVCGYDNTRKALQSICFDQLGAVSTDGKRMQIAAAFFKGDGANPEVRFAAMEQKETGEKLISMVNPEQKIRKEFLLDESFDGGFPEYKLVIPKSETTLEISISLNLLLDLLTQMKKAQGDNPAEFVEFKFHGERGIFELTLGEDENAIRAYMSPCLKEKD